MTNATETMTSGPAVVENPEPVQPETASQAETAPPPESASQPESTEPQASAPETPGAANSDDFAAALENFTTETEDAVGDDHVIHGTVIKLTPTHVVVDIG